MEENQRPPALILDRMECLVYEFNKKGETWHIKLLQMLNKS